MRAGDTISCKDNSDMVNVMRVVRAYKGECVCINYDKKILQIVKDMDVDNPYREKAEDGEME